MKKFSINCDFGGQMAPFTIYVGRPEEGHHPLHFQAELLTQRGGTIPSEVMDAVAELNKLAAKNNVSLEELCVYALGVAQEEDEIAASSGLGAEENQEQEAAEEDAEALDNEQDQEEIELSEEQDKVAEEDALASALESSENAADIEQESKNTDVRELASKPAILSEQIVKPNSKVRKKVQIQDNPIANQAIDDNKEN